MILIRRATLYCHISCLGFCNLSIAAPTSIILMAAGNQHMNEVKI